MSYYIFTIDYFLKDFYKIESSSTVAFKLENKDRLNEVLEPQDLVYCYYKSEDPGINLLLKVEDIDEDTITFKKIFEIDKKLKLADILEPSEISSLSIEYTLKKINESVNQSIFNSLIQLLESYHDVTPLENYESLEINKCTKTIQNIYFGAPGTGKSRKTENLIKQSYPDYRRNSLVEDFIYRTTIYSDYSYYDFIGNIMPVSKDNNITYDFNPGPFTLALKQALQHPDFDTYLIVEEMSRGDIAAIFGDIFQLLDRDNEGKSEYLIDNSLIADFLNSYELIKDNNKISLPSNLHILGTVNTSDQNVNTIDTAFKRRFEFEYISVDPIDNKNELLKRLDNEDLLLNSFTFSLNNSDPENSEVEFEWNKLYMAINKFIIEKLALSEDKQIGQFFLNFMDEEKDDHEKFVSINNKLLHYLWDDIQNITFTTSNLFDERYNAFSKIYSDFNKRKNVFSTEFLDLYTEFKL